MDLIIGGGVTGLSYAAFSSNDYLIIEKESECGGYCRTTKRNGYVWDYSGHFFHFRDSRIEKFVCMHIPQDRLCRVQKRTQIYYRGNYIDFPFQKNIHQLEKEEFIDCLYDLFHVENTNISHSFKEMVGNHFGASIAHKFLIPYNEKLYACDLDLLDAEAMGRFFPKASRDEIIDNFRKSKNDSYNSYFVYPSGGAIEYIHSLEKRLDSSKFLLNEKVLSIDLVKQKVKTNCREIPYDNLISTIPFVQLLQLCGFSYEPTVYTSNKVMVFNLGFDRKGRDKVNHWVYFPEKEYVFYRVGYYDNIMDTDKMSLYVEIGFPENAEFVDERVWLKKVIEDLKKAGIVEEQQLMDYEMILMNPAYVHINQLQLQDIKKQKELLAGFHIYSIGRYGSWTYCSIEDNVIEARNLAVILNKV